MGFRFKRSCWQILFFHWRHSNNSFIVKWVFISAFLSNPHGSAAIFVSIPAGVLWRTFPLSLESVSECELRINDGTNLVGWLVFNGTFSINRVYCAIGVRDISCRVGDKTNKLKQYTKPKQVLFGLGFVETIFLPWTGFLRVVFLANHLASADNSTRTTKRQNTYTQTNWAQKWL